MLIRVIRWLVAAPFFITSMFMLSLFFLRDGYLIPGGFASNEYGGLPGLSGILFGAAMISYVPVFVGQRLKAWYITARILILVSMLMLGVAYVRFRGF